MPKEFSHRRKGVSPKDVETFLRQFEGVEDAQRRRRQLIVYGEAIHRIRKTHLKLTVQDAAALIGMEPQDLQVLENGACERDPSLTLIEYIVNEYNKYLSQHSRQTIKLSLTVENSSEPTERDEVVLAGKSAAVA